MRFYMSSVGDHCYDYCSGLKHHPVLKEGDMSKYINIRKYILNELGVPNSIQFHVL